MSSNLREKIISLLYDQTRKIFGGLYQYWVLGRDKLVSSTVYKSATMLLATLQSHDMMAEFSIHEIKFHPSITSIFFRFLIMDNIYEPLQEITRMNRYIRVLRTN